MAQQSRAEGKCPKDVEHRRVKYLNTVIEADHGTRKQRIKPVRGYKPMKTAHATIIPIAIGTAETAGCAC